MIVSDLGDENPCKEGNVLARILKSEGRGFKSWCRQIFFLVESVQVLNLFVFVYDTGISQSCIM